ncbi:hypothetical protein RQM47_06780 [Rubrivirga sp. S365]|uniref:Uncharacterized protein n=1 Tax=Rubrivirga litoralis TaxID=3075598 RepID=A0ABU3BSK3_9BACT|nr:MULTISPECIES: hypothetical protein [unclassified Rubrivirga]MDT0632276.1 hypothetical protein [Rubrivirga sp. F394]MDT7856339.1 hypothetical protein [Rubrivirga sp. S365]
MISLLLVLVAEIALWVAWHLVARRRRNGGSGEGPPPPPAPRPETPRSPRRGRPAPARGPVARRRTARPPVRTT